MVPYHALCRLHCFLKSHRGGSSSLGVQTCAFTQGPKGALVATNLGVWVQLVQGRVAPVQRLRKHDTTAEAGAEDCRVHYMLRQTGLADWQNGPLVHCNLSFIPSRAVMWKGTGGST